VIIIGAKGFAKEVLQILFDNGQITEDLMFYDDVSEDLPNLIYDQFQILRTPGSLMEHFKNHSPEFILGIGGATIRRNLYEKITKLGGKLISAISCKASIGNFGTTIGTGVCISTNAIITNDVHIGDGTLINKGSIISHDVRIGEFCDVAPGVIILGRASVGDYSEIGGNAVILPGIKVGSSVKIGAGAVVVKNVPDNSVVVGIPAQLVTKNN
jgi:sugar O-acyltransferase (sialic acid O-acetyltransferase NeuD family)